MTKSELLQIIANGENSGVEFKRDGLRPEQLAKEIVALANFKGGRILIGVEDDGTISGIVRDKVEHWVMDTVFARYVHPMIIPFYEEVKIDESRRVAVITIDQGTTKPYVVRQSDQQTIYVRFGSTSRYASREKQARLFASGGMLIPEKFPVSGTGFQDLSLVRLTDYLLRIAGDEMLPVSEKMWEKRLCNLDFMIERDARPPVCTIAGLVLFGNAPSRHLPHAVVRWMAFEGDDKDYQALDDREIDGPLVAHRKETTKESSVLVENGLIENLLVVMRPFVSQEPKGVDESMRRERNWFYPIPVIREAIVNAIAHRDWTRYEDIEIVQYVDRLEIQSPGTLPNSLTIEKMLAGQRALRNQKITEILSYYDYVDKRGMGVRKTIVPLMLKHNNTKPKFILTDDYLKVVLYRNLQQSIENQ